MRAGGTPGRVTPWPTSACAPSSRDDVTCTVTPVGSGPGPGGPHASRHRAHRRRGIDERQEVCQTHHCRTWVFRQLHFVRGCSGWSAVGARSAPSTIAAAWLACRPAYCSGPYAWPLIWGATAWSKKICAIGGMTTNAGTIEAVTGGLSGVALDRGHGDGACTRPCAPRWPRGVAEDGFHGAGAVALSTARHLQRQPAAVTAAMQEAGHLTGSNVDSPDGLHERLVAGATC